VSGHSRDSARGHPKAIARISAPDRHHGHAGAETEQFLTPIPRKLTSSNVRAEHQRDRRPTNPPGLDGDTENGPR
jgi:hypothetical protein